MTMFLPWWLRAAAPVRWLHGYVSRAVPDGALTAVFGLWCVLGVISELLRLRRVARHQ
jgi:hypothetical protein